MMRSEEVAASPGWLTIESIRDGAAFAAIRTEWDRLHATSRASVFTRWEWLYPWWRRLGADRRLMILTARDVNGELVGLMPLCLQRRRRLWRLSFLGETHVGSDYLDVVAREGCEVQVAQSFAQSLRVARGEWDAIDLLDLDQDSPTVPVLREAFSAPRYRYELSERFTCPRQRFEPGLTWDAFLRGTGRRDNYLRRFKWLSKQPGFRIEKTTAPDELARPLADFFRLHALRWSDDGGSQGIRGPSVEAFHRDATWYLADRGLLRLYTLRVGEAAVASVYGIVYRGEFIYFQSGYDPAWRDKSVGLVLVGETFKDAIEGGLTGYDFLRGTETYKSDWTTQERRTVALRFAHGKGTWLGREERVARAVRDAARKVLPSRVVEQLRRVRRTRSRV
jgi:CelD/BcsL family acetyltransferase involved in cellulose biosynthesis